MSPFPLTSTSLLDYSRYLSLLSGNTAYSPSSFDLLETQVLTGSQSSVTFSNLQDYASTYQHLQIRSVARGTRAANGDNLSVRFNGDTGNNYARHAIYGEGASAGSYGVANNSFIDLGTLASSATPANAFTGAVADILDPFETTKNKVVRSLNGLAAAGNFIGLASGLWLSTSAITSMTIFAVNGNLVQYSRFSLYGLRAVA